MKASTLAMIGGVFFIAVVMTILWLLYYEPMFKPEPLGVIVVLGFSVVAAFTFMWAGLVIRIKESQREEELRAIKSKKHAASPEG